MLSIESHSPLTVQGHSSIPDTQCSQGNSSPVFENSPQPNGNIGESSESHVKLTQLSVLAQMDWQSSAVVMFNTTSKMLDWSQVMFDLRQEGKGFEGSQASEREKIK